MNKKEAKEARRLLHYLLLQAGFDDIRPVKKMVAKPGGERTPLRGDLDKKRQLVCDEGAGEKFTEGENFREGENSTEGENFRAGESFMEGENFNDR